MARGSRRHQKDDDAEFHGLILQIRMYLNDCAYFSKDHMYLKKVFVRRRNITIKWICVKRLSPQVRPQPVFASDARPSIVPQLVRLMNFAFAGKNSSASRIRLSFPVNSLYLSLETAEKQSSTPATAENDARVTRHAMNSGLV